MSISNPSGGASGLVQLATTAAGSAVATLTLTVSTAGYSRLLLVIQGSCDNGTQNALIQFNGDAAAHYGDCGSYNNGTVVSSNNHAVGGNDFAFYGVAVTTTPWTAYIVIDNDGTRALNGVVNFASVGTSQAGGISWNQTAKITSITILLSANNYNTGSKMTLYGMV